MSREETVASREEARATVRFRPVDYDRARPKVLEDEGDPNLSVYVARQGPFRLGHVLRYPAGNFGFMIDSQLHERLLNEREFARSPYNVYVSLFMTAREDGTRIDSVFATEDEVRAAVTTLRDSIFSWCLDVVVERMTTSADDEGTAGMRE